MKEQLFKLFTEMGRPLTKEAINACPWLPSYNTIQRKGFNLSELNVEFYYKIPNLCKECHEPIPYDKRNTNVFCSSSCSATHNNKLRVDSTEVVCIHCHTVLRLKVGCKH